MNIKQKVMFVMDSCDALQSLKEELTSFEV